MEDLVAFIRARLAEIEATANAAATSGNQFAAKDEFAPGWWHVRNSGEVRGDAGIVVFDEGAPSAGQAAHIALHDPAYELRVTMTMRAILVLGEPMASRLLGAIWIGHPDYRDEWKP
jgi:hypothetical protein